MKSTNANVVEWYATCPYCDDTVDEYGCQTKAVENGWRPTKEQRKKLEDNNVWICPNCKQLFKIDSWDT